MERRSALRLITYRRVIKVVYLLREVFEISDGMRWMLVRGVYTRQ